MTNPATPKLLSLIRKIREERRSGDLTRLTDAELVAKLARALSDDKGDERLIACAVAVKWMASYARRDQRNGDLERALELLQEAGYSEFSLGQLAAVRQSAAFRNCGILRQVTSRGGSSLKSLSNGTHLLIAAGAAARGLV